MQRPGAGTDRLRCACSADVRRVDVLVGGEDEVTPADRVGWLEWPGGVPRAEHPNVVVAPGRRVVGEVGYRDAGEVPLEDRHARECGVRADAAVSGVGEDVTRGEVTMNVRGVLGYLDERPETAD